MKGLHLSHLRQPIIPTMELSPVMRTFFIIVSIFSGLYFGLTTIVITLISISIFYAFANLASTNLFAASLHLTVFLGSILLYGTLCALSFIFAIRLIKKQPLLQAQLVVFLVLLLIAIPTMICR